MPHFFIDVQIDNNKSIDDEGMEFSTLEEAKNEAYLGIVSIAARFVKHKSPFIISSTVRDESGVRCVGSLEMNVSLFWVDKT